MSDAIKKKIFFLTFLITYRCTNECKHCALQASPTQDDISIELEDVKRYMKDITTDFEIGEIGFFGGEPFLNFDLLLSLVKEVHDYNIPRMGLPTNGFWGENESIARDHALKLKEAGLNHIGFSVDAFHQEFIPVDVVKRAIRAAHDAGIEWIHLIAQKLGVKNEKNSFNERTNKIIDALSKEFHFLETIITDLQVRGRAVKKLTREYLRTMTIVDRCLFFKTPAFMIDPFGWVFHQNCQGICIGNAKVTLLSEIIKNYDYRNHPIIGKLVAKGGPQNLLEMAVEKGYEPHDGYADKCHLCFSALNYLRPYYPNILEPSNLYF